jgi:hypothetical protein
MRASRSAVAFLLVAAPVCVPIPAAAEAAAPAWTVGAPVLLPGPPGSIDETSVKDPTVVRHDGRWHVFYTARGRGEYTTATVSAASWEALRDAPRHPVKTLRGRKSAYGCAPQVFFFEPQKTWYLIAQTRDANYQPVYVTTATIERPDSWTGAAFLVEKDEKPKWIDFWVICDDRDAHLFYTRSHRDVYVRTTRLADFPKGWGAGRKVFSGIHEAVHVYKVKGRDAYHLLYELNHGGVRSFGLARSPRLAGPWEQVSEAYATGAQLRWAAGATPWTEMVSHGEFLRTGCDQRLEYDADRPALLIQGMMKADGGKPYPELPWRLGIIRRGE